LIRNKKMKLKFEFAWALADPLVYLRGMTPRVQNLLKEYKWRLLATSVIPDGNRRCSRKFHMNSTVEGHREWVRTIENIILHLRQKRSNVVDEVTFWWLSRENKKRPEDELQGLYKLLREFKPRLLEMSHKNSIHAFMIWDESLLPPDIVDIMKELSDETNQYNSTFRCALALGYDLEWEVNRQADVLVADWFRWNQNVLRENAFQIGHKKLREPDLLLRAGSNWRHRTSGGFTWSNTALHFFRAHWPTITTKHMDFALHSAIMEEINNGK